MENPKLLYHEKFPVGTSVRVMDKRELERFYREWKYHHPLQPEQLSYAGRAANVVRVSFYHGGDVLYELLDFPGTWHEECLSRNVTESDRLDESALL